MTRCLHSLLFVLLLLAITTTGSAQPGVLNEAQEAMRRALDPLSLGDSLEIGGTHVASGLLLFRIYERRTFDLAWPDAEGMDALVRSAERMYLHGLNPEDYHLSELKRRRLALRAAPLEARRMEQIQLDILFTDSLIRMLYHVTFGKVVPEAIDPNWNFERRLPIADPVGALVRLIDGPRVSLEESIFAVTRRPFFYQRLKNGLADYRAIAATGGWPQIPPGPTLKVGMRDDRVTLLRERLRITGDLPRSASSNDLRYFDAGLEQAVIGFQHRHQLEPDGAVGTRTLHALNVPVEERIGTIRVNLERMRWIYRDLPDTFVLVDIAGFHVYLVRDAKVVWDSRAQVGKAYRKTPVFRAMLTYLEFNPTWTVPPTILRKDILPRLRQDPDYLASRHIRVLDHNGRPVEIADWSKIAPSSFPYLLRQDPGPDNALGQVKFMFPNEHFVYMHDTPNKNLFNKTQRAFSSGCIRIERPFELAELVLDRPQQWNQRRFDEIRASRKTQTVMLEKPLPVLLLYFTAEVDAEGRIHFREDLYGRDRRVLEALDGKFVFSPPAELQERLTGG